METTITKGSFVTIPEKYCTGNLSYLKNKPQTVYEVNNNIAYFIVYGPILKVNTSELTLFTEDWISFSNDKTTLIEDSRFSNGIELYEAASLYLKSIGKYSDDGHLSLKIKVYGKICIEYGDCQKTITIDKLRSFSNTIHNI